MEKISKSSICPECPKCGEDAMITANDGGSFVHCGILFHWCKGKPKYGSPGPIICPDCDKRYQVKILLN